MVFCHFFGPAHAAIALLSSTSEYSHQNWPGTADKWFNSTDAACNNALAYANSVGSAYVLTSVVRTVCSFGSNGAIFLSTRVVDAICPPNSVLSGTSCICSVTYIENSTKTACEIPPNCPVAELKPLDPAVQRYEGDLPDMDNVTDATRAGAACIMRAARGRHITSRIISGYRPPAYQTHLLEVYDKSQLLKNNNDLACADIKAQVEVEFNHHRPFAHRPGETSRHSTGRAVDISLSSYATADEIAAGCGMSRAVPNDRVHFEPLR